MDCIYDRGPIRSITPREIQHSSSTSSNWAYTMLKEMRPPVLRMEAQQRQTAMNISLHGI